MAVKSAPGTDRVYGICLVHLILCIAIIAGTTQGSSPLTLGGVQIAPTLQWWNAAFAALSMGVIILAAVGVLYLVEWHLDVYVALLLASIAIDIFWFGAFLVFGSSCPSGSATSCSFSSGGVILAITAIVLFKIFALWAVMKAKRAVRIKYNEELLPFLRKNLSTTIGGVDVLEGEATGMGGDDSQFGGASGQVGNGGAAASGGAGASNGRSGKSVSFAASPEVVNVGGTGSCNGSPMPTVGYGATADAPPQQCGGVVGPYASGCGSSYYGCAAPAAGPGMACAGPAAAGGMYQGGASPVATSSGIAPFGPAGTPVGSTMAVPCGALPGAPPGSLVINAPGGVAVSMPPAPAPVPPAAVPPPTYAAAPADVMQSMASVPPTPVAVSVPGSGTVLMQPTYVAEPGGVEAIFDQIDKNGDGVITREDWHRFSAGVPRSPSGSSASMSSESSG